MAATSFVVAGSGWELANPFIDGISNLRFSNYSNHFLASSWNIKVRLYDASVNSLKGQFVYRDPVLDCCFHNDESGFSGSADNAVRRMISAPERRI